MDRDFKSNERQTKQAKETSHRPAPPPPTPARPQDMFEPEFMLVRDDH